MTPAGKLPRGRPKKETVKTGFGVSMPPDLVARLRAEVGAGRWRSLSAALTEITRAHFTREDAGKSKE